MAILRVTRDADHVCTIQPTHIYHALITRSSLYVMHPFASPAYCVNHCWQLNAVYGDSIIAICICKIQAEFSNMALSVPLSQYIWTELKFQVTTVWWPQALSMDDLPVLASSKISCWSGMGSRKPVLRHSGPSSELHFFTFRRRATIKPLLLDETFSLNCWTITKLRICLDYYNMLNCCLMKGET